MQSRKMLALTYAIAITAAVTTAAAAEPRILSKSPLVLKAVKTERCLPLGKPCLTSKLPCCTLTYQNTYMGFGTVPTTCFKFGKGICQVNQSIKNLTNYNRIVAQLNATNSKELKTEYWNSIPALYACVQLSKD